MKFSLCFGLLIVIASTSITSIPSPADEVTPPTQLVLKHDFERVDSIANWKEELPKDVAPNILGLETSDSHSGRSALKFEIAHEGASSATAYTGANINQNNVAGRTVRLRMFARTENIAMDSVQIRLLERDATSVTGWIDNQTNWLTLKPSQKWQNYEKTATLAAATQGVTLYITVEKPKAGQKIWIDDVSLEVLPPSAK